MQHSKLQCHLFFEMNNQMSILLKCNVYKLTLTFLMYDDFSFFYSTSEYNMKLFISCHGKRSECFFLLSKITNF